MHNFLIFLLLSSLTFACDIKSNEVVPMIESNYNEFTMKFDEELSESNFLTKKERLNIYEDLSTMLREDNAQIIHFFEEHEEWLNTEILMTIMVVNMELGMIEQKINNTKEQMGL
ncbi:MAG: hypothetical protein ACRCZ9_06735 [Fusobacteriaceae bacterium]